MKSNLHYIIFLFVVAILLMVHSTWSAEESKNEEVPTIKKVEHLSYSYEATFPLDPREIELNNGALELNAKAKGRQYIVSAIPKTAAEAPRRLDAQFLAFHRRGAEQSNFWKVREARVFNEEGVDKALLILEGGEWIRHVLFVDQPDVGFVVEATLKDLKGHDEAKAFLESFHFAKQEEK